MTVGLVVVSHSSRIAVGTVELAGQMAEGVAIEPAGGTDDGGIGTSFDLVTSALAAADSGDGVVVLCDLGSAVLTAETALELLDDEARARVRIADAPVVEGAVAAAVAARVGGDLDAVLAAAESAGAGDGVGAGDGPAGAEPTESVVGAADGAILAAAGGAEARERPAAEERRVTLVNGSGLHARPAAEFVRTAAAFDAAVTVDGVDATSLLRILTLGARRGRELVLRATGPDATAALDALASLVDSGFGEE